MQDQNTQGPNGQAPNGATGTVSATNTSGANEAPKDRSAPAERTVPEVARAARGDYVRKIIDKMKKAENILVALSKEPSIDEMAAAIGLTMYLDEMQKHVTAIHSGEVPQALAFLHPELTFETDTDVLQDFVISLNKEKADHLRYKLEGDDVKVYITPYRTVLSQDDLTFMKGDYNVDFVMALNVKTAADLDPALAENPNVLHDASVVNLTTDVPRKFGELVWSNPTASSVSEMVTQLIFDLKDDDAKPLNKEIATALLAGIVSATERFSNNRTTSETMQIASKLMSMGADQQLIATNLMAGQNEGEDLGQMPMPRMELEVDHAMPNLNPATYATPNVPGSVDGGQMNMTAVTGTNEAPVGDVVVQPVVPAMPGMANEPVQNTEKPAEAVAATPVETATSVAETVATNPVAPEVPAEPVTPTPGTFQVPSSPEATGVGVAGGTTLTPPAPANEGPKDYALMMEQALAEVDPLPTPMQPVASQPVQQIPQSQMAQPAMNQPTPVVPPAAQPAENRPAEAKVPGEPVANPIDKTILPPPPAPETGGNIMPPGTPVA